MNYFNLRTSTELDIIGWYPQVMDLKQYQPSDFEKFGYLSQLADTDLPDLHQFLLNDGAVLTDSLHNTFFSTINGFLISRKARHVFEQFESAGIGYFNATVHCFEHISRREGPTIEHPYCFLRVQPVQHIYNYQHSFFEVRDDLFGKSEGQIAIDSYEHLVEENKKLFARKEIPASKVTPKRLQLIKRVDMFRFPHSQYVLVSPRLKEAIEQAGLTGFRFTEIDCDIVF